MMSYRMARDPKQAAYYYALSQVRDAINEAFSYQKKKSGITMSELAKNLGKDKSFISKKINDPDNITLRSLADIMHGLGHVVLISGKPIDVIEDVGNNENGHYEKFEHKTVRFEKNLKAKVSTQHIIYGES